LSKRKGRKEGRRGGRKGEKEGGRNYPNAKLVTKKPTYLPTFRREECISESIMSLKIRPHFQTRRSHHMI
jgi:hypothetical protein